MNDLKNVVSFIQSNSHTNINLLGVPCHFELMKSSRINEKIHICKFIRKFEKLVKKLKHVSLVKINHKRESFIQH